MHVKDALMDTLLGTVLSVIALIFIVIINPLSIELPTAAYQDDTAAITPAYFPTMVCWAWLVCSLCLTYSGVRALRQQGRPTSSGMTFASDTRAVCVRVAAMVTLVLIYFVAEQLGILIAGFIFYLLFSYFTGERKHLRAFLGAFITTITLYYFFVHIGQVPLPLGPLENFL